MTPRTDGDGVPAGTAALITGGLGALGLASARHLAARGITAITLMGRGEPDESARAAIADLTASGVAVTVVRGDVTDPGNCREAVAEAGRDRPLRTVLHLAGAVRDGSLETMDADDFGAVFAAKAVGADTLADALAGHELAAFVVYSSASSVIGTPGQANYAAANGYLNGLVTRLRSRGVPAIAAVLGPWLTAAGGMASSQAVSRAASALAISPLTDEQAAEVLDRVLAGDLAHPVALGLDAAGYATAFAGHPRAALVEELLQAGAVTAAPPPGSGATRAARGWLAAELAGLDAQDREEGLRDAVRKLADTIIGQDGAVGADAGFAEAGLDSIMVIDLRTRLGEGLDLELPATVAIDHPTIDRLSAYLAARLDGPATDDGPARSPGERPPDPVAGQQEPPADLTTLSFQDLIAAVQADVGDRT